MKALELTGAPGSPYTRKMLALLRFRRIPYQVQWQSLEKNSAPHRQKNYPQPKVPLLPTFYLPDEGEVKAITDSSPLLRRFEKEYEGRSSIPTDEVLAFINWLVEDYGDEWLTKAMFHYRWHYAEDVKKAGSILPRWGNITGADKDIAPMSHYISERQISRLAYVGSNEITKTTIEESFKRFLALFNAHLQHSGFMFGARPSSADFAIYGQLTQLALFDPTSQKVIVENFPRIYAWTELMEDLSGYEVAEGDWLDIKDGLPKTLIALLTEIGALYLPYLKANAEAVQAGAKQVESQLDGRAWTQNPFPYQAKCLAWIVQEYKALKEADKSRLAKLMAGTQIIEQIK